MPSESEQTLLGNPKVRQAILAAMDFEEIMEAASDGQYKLKPGSRIVESKPQAAKGSAPAANAAFSALSGAQQLVVAEHLGYVFDYYAMPGDLWENGTETTSDDVARPDVDAGWSSLTAAQRAIVTHFIDNVSTVTARALPPGVTDPNQFVLVQTGVTLIREPESAVSA